MARHQNRPAHTSLNTGNSSSHEHYELLAFYDCMCSMAYALILQRNGSLSDHDYSLLNQSYKEIILLINNRQFLDGKYDVCNAVDTYLAQKLHALGESFCKLRSIDNRLQIALNLLMREHCLAAIQILTKIQHALCRVIVPEGLQIWDQTIDSSVQKNIVELKGSYVLLDRFTTKVAFPSISPYEEKQLAVLLALHHAVKDMPPEIYMNGKTQFYFLQQILQASYTLGQLSTELPLVLAAESNEMPSGTKASEMLFAQTESITDCLIKILEACAEGHTAFAKVVAPTMNGMIAANRVFNHAINTVSLLPRKGRGARAIPETVHRNYTENSRWINYRRHNLQNAKHKLIFESRPA